MPCKNCATAQSAPETERGGLMTFEDSAHARVQAIRPDDFAATWI